MKLTLAAGLFVAASGAAFAQAPAGSSTQNATLQRLQPSTQQNGQSESTQQTVTGCLTQDENIFTLTVLDDSGTPGTTASTTTYTLAPGTAVDLKSFVNKRVTVKGSDAGPGMQNSERVVQSSPATPAPTGTSGTATPGTSGTTGTANGSANGSDNPNATGTAGTSGNNPTVQTTSKARINAKTLNVTDVQPAPGTCGAQ